MWHGILGHDAVVARFRQALERGRLASTFLFVGPAGIGKRAFALKLAQALLCERRSEALLDPCGQCPSCVRVAAGTHPDVIATGKPSDKSFIPVAALIGDAEHRMQEGFCHDISLKPFMGGRKIGIIDDADFLNIEGANALLKTLEEPPPRSVLILIGTSADKQLPTIRSRSQIVRFHPLSTDDLSKLLLKQGIASDPAEAARIAQFSEGSLDRAAELTDPELWDFRREMLATLAARPLDSVRLAQTLSAFIDAAGKEAPPRRARSRLLISFAIDLFRAILRQLYGAAEETDVEQAEAGSSAIARRAVANGWTQPATIAALERCLEALAHIDRNANQGTMVEAWTDELATAQALRL